MAKAKVIAELLGGTYAERMARAAEQGFDTAKVWYHGANRLDRLLEKPNIQSKRATSGPMPFFTDNPEIASNYAKGKADTSRLADYDFDYNDWFKVSSGRGKAKRLDQAWHYLSPEEQARIRDSIGKVTQDDEGLFMAGDGPGGQAHWEWTLKQHRGNALAAARDVWLDSGNLFNDEEKFMEVLRRGGLDRPVQYDSPHITAPGVLPVYSRVANPMDTSNQEALIAVASAIERAAKGKRSRSGFGVDQWDKNTIGLKEFSARLQDDLKNGTTHAWTSIPDDVTAVIKGMGYDGILDRGGKNGGYGHNVLIPFDENQIRSINADFNPANIDSNNLLAGVGGAAVIGGAALAPGEAEAAAAINNFQSRRASKRDYWRQMRQEIIDFANEVAGGAFAALDKPLQGYMALSGVAGALAAGGSLPQALQQGARIAAQPSNVTANQYGQTMTDALTPYLPHELAAAAGALTNAGIQLTSPL